ncbi:hypothetical protein [Acidithiobacillus acidisediminis]|uniref:hypothetical protein n=1 Tax=Acidithiobacillus acidisediminis TaxID=2937799 RepID=UPI00201028B7|nr:hypothetical protein [Acidithiobacillus sp. S30A2]
MEKLRGKLPRLKVRMGVLPTKVERDRKVYSRKEKHKTDYRADADTRGRNPLSFVEGSGLCSQAIKFDHG